MGLHKHILVVLQYGSFIFGKRVVFVFVLRDGPDQRPVSKKGVAKYLDRQMIYAATICPFATLCANIQGNLVNVHTRMTSRKVYG